MSVEDLSDAVLMLASGTYTVTRRGSTTLVNGRRTAPSTSTLSVRALAYPMSGRDKLSLPEGLRTRETMAVVTVEELQTAEGSVEPDLISIDGDTFEVQKVERWDKLGKFWRSIVARV